MALSTKPLTPSIGVEVKDLDVRDVTDREVEELRDLWSEHLVLLFRDQTLTAREQTAFAGLFGPLGQVANVTDTMDEASRQIMMISNRPVDGMDTYLPDGEMWFHFDQAYVAVPITAGFLYGIEVPSTGGDTLFANAQAAYAGLGQDLKRRLVGHEAENVYDYRTTTRVLRDGEEASACIHPVVIGHPVTGKPSLFVSPLMTRRIDGLPEDESRRLLDELCAHIEREEFVYRHAWWKGDLVVWDNRAVLHARTDFDPSESRILRRLSIAGERTPEPFVVARAS